MLLVILLSLAVLTKGCGQAAHSANVYSKFKSFAALGAGSHLPPTSRIIGGERAYLGAWPWQAFIRYTDTRDQRQYICGGSLISKRHVITAAHCALYMDATRSWVSLGVVDVSQTALISRGVARRTVNKDYSGNLEINPTMLNDIAILTLDGDVPFSSDISPICIQSPELELSLDYGYLTGYGAYNKGNVVVNSPSQFLQQVMVPIVDQERCSKLWMNIPARQGGGFTIDESQICAGSYGKGTGQGDSGGPLQVQASDGRWFLVGLTSFGVNSGPLYYDQATAPGIYTRVSYFCDFIKDESDVECSANIISLLIVTIVMFFYF